MFGTLQVSVPDEAIDKALIDGEINGTEPYTRNDSKAIDLVAIELLQGLLAAPDVSEGGYSVKHDRKAVQARLSYLCQKHGVVDSSKPAVRGRRPW